MKHEEMKNKNIETKQNQFDPIITWPMISIVTPTLNRAHMLEDAIKSVLEQNYPNFEHIIVDSSSTDNTNEILSKYPHLCVIREPDRNVYDGLNKGIKLAKGDIIGHLNSDDLYDENVFFNVANAFLENSEIDVVSGGAQICEFLSNGKKLILSDYNEPSYKTLCPHNASLKPPIINARFFRHRVYERLGDYNINFSLAADRDFLMRVIISNMKGISFPQNFYLYRAHLDSLTFHRSWKRKENGIHENLNMAEHYLAINNDDKKMKQTLRKWHSINATAGLFATLLNRNYKKIFKYYFRGWRFEWRWPLVFITTAFTITFSELTKFMVNKYNKRKLQS